MLQLNDVHYCDCHIEYAKESPLIVPKRASLDVISALSRVEQRTPTQVLEHAADVPPLNIKFNVFVFWDSFNISTIMLQRY